VDIVDFNVRWRKGGVKTGETEGTEGTEGTDIKSPFPQQREWSREIIRM